MTTVDPTYAACPVPLPESERVLLGHGAGGQLSADLVTGLLLPALGSAAPAGPLEDAAVVPVGGVDVVISTDAYVVSPLFFPGGDIGCLAVHGTVNDLAMRAATPVALALAYVVEEGFPLADLRRVAASAGRAAAAAGVAVVCGDTKVVGRAPPTACTSCPPGSATARPGPRRRRAPSCPATWCCCPDRSAVTAPRSSACARASASTRTSPPTPARCTGSSPR
ncbi:AIR synthase related protein [Luedemannella flava]